MSEQRRHAAEAATVGGAMVGGAALANHGLDRMLERKGVNPPVRALIARKPSRWHVPYAAGKLGTRAVQTVGVPLAAYGAFNLVSPADKVARVRLKDDVARPVAEQASGVAAARKAKQHIRQNRSTRRKQSLSDVAKSQLSEQEYEALRRRKQMGRNLSLASGTMGLGALALRAPDAARMASKIKGAGRLKLVQRVAAKEPQATRASNTLGIAAIGTGSLGSFNYAAQQKLERKQVTKAQGTYFNRPQPLERDSGRTRRARTEIEHQGYRGAAFGLGAASSAAVGARWLGHKNAPVAISAAGHYARRQGIPKATVQAAQARAHQIGRWSKNKRGRLLVGALAAGGGSTAMGAMARWKRDEAQGISQDLGRAASGYDYSVRKAGTTAAAIELGGMAARQV